MFSKFLNLEEEKQNRILNAAMKEFSLKGYDNASTNEIVKNAKISKGLLFHYFSNKKQLFLFLYDHCIETVLNDFYKKINLEEKDFFVRFKEVQRVKLELLNKYPEMFKFLQNAYVETSGEVKPSLDDVKRDLLFVNANKVFEGIDESKFKDGLDMTKVMSIILWTFQGFIDDLLMKAKLTPENSIDYDKVFEEVDIYIKMFRDCFYK